MKLCWLSCLPYDEFANTFCWLLPILPQEQALMRLTSTNKENPRSTGPIYQVCMKHGPRHGYSRKQEAVTCSPCCCQVLMHERGGNPGIRKIPIKNGRGGTWNRNSINIEPDLIMSSLSFICSIRNSYQKYYVQDKRASTLCIYGSYITIVCIMSVLIC